MRPLIARRGPVLHDPAPSRLRYRATRLWLTPLFRKVLRLGLPVAVIGGAVGWYISDQARVEALNTVASEVRREIENRPEFRVNVMGIDGASPQVTEEVRAAMSLDLPISSFDLDLDDLRARVEALPPIRSADLRVQSGGYLSVRVDERQPAALWRTFEGTVIVDDEGHFLAAEGTRDLDGPLPLVVGQGVDLVMDEALRLLATTAPLGDDVHALQRIGERRWDVVLTSGVRLMLPEQGAVAALNHILAFDDVGDLLSQDIAAVDLRMPQRPTVRLTANGIENYRGVEWIDPTPAQEDDQG